MGEVVSLFDQKCVALRFKRWENSRKYRELVAFVGPFPDMSSAKVWRERLQNILDIDGEIVIKDTRIGIVPWKWLREHGRTLVRPYDEGKQTIWTFVHSLERAIQKCKLIYVRQKKDMHNDILLSKIKGLTRDEV